MKMMVGKPAGGKTFVTLVPGYREHVHVRQAQGVAIKDVGAVCDTLQAEYAAEKAAQTPG